MKRSVKLLHEISWTTDLVDAVVSMFARSFVPWVEGVLSRPGGAERGHAVRWKAGWGDHR
jgi:hypothetical protein